MNFRPGLPELSILNLEQIIPHEHVDDRRIVRLTEVIEGDGVLKNPPVVLSPSAAFNKYIVLDGASRTAAFRALGIKHILVQVVDPARESIQVEAWNHAVLGSKVEDLFARLEQDPAISLSPVSEHNLHSSWDGGNPAVLIVTHDQRTFQATSKVKGYESQIEFLNWIVSTYHEAGDVERTVTSNAAQLPQLYPDFGYLVILPRFELGDVLNVTQRNLLFPAGLTRFIILPRALRVNYPLSSLMLDLPVEEKRHKLNKWLKEKTSQRGIRFYGESVFLYDE
ncbi:MAG: hypothetical protein IIC78_12320 [Chloroflexi bacterium]|nr:hypothetical protein [Chloroflexota bacterium]